MNELPPTSEQVDTDFEEFQTEFVLAVLGTIFRAADHREAAPKVPALPPIRHTAELDLTNATTFDFDNATYREQLKACKHYNASLRFYQVVKLWCSSLLNLCTVPAQRFLVVIHRVDPHAGAFRAAQFLVGALHSLYNALLQFAVTKASIFVMPWIPPAILTLTDHEFEGLRSREAKESPWQFKDCPLAADVSLHVWSPMPEGSIVTAPIFAQYFCTCVQKLAQQ
jgi:hypothetical protein